MAKMIPRVMSWAVSGTPIKRHLEDLHSLLQFLKQEPLGSNKKMWKLLNLKAFRSTLISCYQRIMNRYSKRDIEQELSLPRQHRIVYGIHFSEIERANYDELWENCLADCEIAFTNHKLDAGDSERLQSWLVRLRQTWYISQLDELVERTISGVLARMLNSWYTDSAPFIQ
jgi:E3 ubiquitin-protein ligase SHPRH